MAETTEFELVSPERLLMQRPVEMVVLPGGEGNFAAMARHAPMISTLRPGVIEVYEKRPEASEKLFVEGGFVEVTPERCTVLADTVTPVGDLDRARIEQDIRDLGEDLADATTAPERAAATRAMAIARAKLVAVGH